MKFYFSLQFMRQWSAIFLTAGCLLSATSAFADKDVNCPDELATHSALVSAPLPSHPSQPIVFPDRLPPQRGSWMDRAIDSSIEKLFGRANYLSTLNYRRFFDATGNFIYRNIRPLVLASETGSQALETIRLNLTSQSRDYDNSAAILEDYGRVLRMFPNLKLKIVTAIFEVATIRKWIRDYVHPDDQKRIEIIWNFNIDRYIWAQDGSKPLATPNATLMQNRGVVENRWGYRQATLALQNSNIEVIRSDLPFEGGNVVVGDFHAFVGSDIIQALMAKLNISRSEALAAYTEQFGKPVIEIGVLSESGDVVQPAFHLDIFMAVVKDRRMPGTKNIVVLQSPALMPKNLLASSTADQNDQLNQVERLLRQNGYDVVRIPGYFSNSKTERSFTYTNAIFSDAIALVPNYDEDTLDNTAYEVYRKLGYHIIPMRSSLLTIEDDGAIRCVSETYREACVNY